MNNLNKVPITSLQHNFDGNEDVSHVSMSFGLYGVKEGSFNATVEVFPEDLPENKTFEDMSPKGLQALGRQKLSQWILVA